MDGWIAYTNYHKRVSIQPFPSRLISYFLPFNLIPLPNHEIFAPTILTEAQLKLKVCVKYRWPRELYEKCLTVDRHGVLVQLLRLSAGVCSLFNS
jgi:hypothetical protein